MPTPKSLYRMAFPPTPKFQQVIGTSVKVAFINQHREKPGVLVKNGMVFRPTTDCLDYGKLSNMSRGLRPAAQINVGHGRLVFMGPPEQILELFFQWGGMRIKTPLAESEPNSRDQSAVSAGLQPLPSSRLYLGMSISDGQNFAATADTIQPVVNAPVTIVKTVGGRAASVVTGVVEGAADVAEVAAKGVARFLPFRTKTKKTIGGARKVKNATVTIGVHPEPGTVSVAANLTEGTLDQLARIITPHLAQRFG